MADMANISVKAANGTTDVIFVKKTPSAGDTVAATWLADALSTYASFRPSYSMKTRFNGPKTARRVESSFRYPVTEVQNSVTVKIGEIPIEINGVIPLNVTDAAIAEAIALAGNLFVSTLVRDSFRAGYAPT